VNPIDYDPFAYEVHEDPYPIYARLREEAPVYRNEVRGFWAFSRHADVLAAIRDTERYTNTYGVSIEPTASHPAAHLAMSFLGMDPPRHTKMRALVSRGFTRNRVAELEPRIREMAIGHLDRMRAQRRCDFIAELAGVLPMDVISELLGVPASDRAELRRQADLLVHREQCVYDVPPAAAEAFVKIWRYFGERIAERRRAPQSDLISALLAAEVDGERLADTELQSFCNLMVVAGNETTTKLLANALYWLWRHPDQRKRIDDETAWIPEWIEETLRYDNSSQAIGRMTKVPISLHGCEIPAGQRVLLLIGSANRDERVFPRADAYDLRRDTNASLAFGQGAHFCLGAAHARLEGRVVLEEFWRRFAGYEVDPSGITRVHSVSVRGFAALPLELRDV
jgi:cytochrome P450